MDGTAWRTPVPSYPKAGLELHGFQIMQTWEAGLMGAMARDVTRRGGSVLEVGYGLGIAAREIRKHRPALHVIIEANEHIAAVARHRYRREIGHGTVRVMNEFWKTAVVRIAKDKDSFDGILFDTFPQQASDLKRNHYAFFPIAQKLLSRGGKFTYFSDEVDSIGGEHQRRLWSAFGPRLTLELTRMRVRPPPSCEYWSARSILHVVVTKR